METKRLEGLPDLFRIEQSKDDDLSAGVPAFWLTQMQLERQAWSQVENAQSAAQSLLEAEQNYLKNQLILFTERPTLQQLAREQSTVELQRY